jgi:hypothetical protein
MGDGGPIISMMWLIYLQGDPGNTNGIFIA